MSEEANREWTLMREYAGCWMCRPPPGTEDTPPFGVLRETGDLFEPWGVRGDKAIDYVCFHTRRDALACLDQIFEDYQLTGDRLARHMRWLAGAMRKLCREGKDSTRAYHIVVARYDALACKIEMEEEERISTGEACLG